MELTEEARIHISFSRDTDMGRFQDTLVFTPQEYSLLSAEGIETLKDQRASKWTQRVEQASSEERVPTLEDLEAEKESILVQLSEINERIAAVKSE